MIIFYDLNWENWDHLMGTKGLAEQVDGCHLVKKILMGFVAMYVVEVSC